MKSSESRCHNFHNIEYKKHTKTEQNEYRTEMSTEPNPEPKTLPPTSSIAKELQITRESELAVYPIVAEELSILSSNKRNHPKDSAGSEKKRPRSSKLGALLDAYDENPQKDSAGYRNKRDEKSNVIRAIFNAYDSAPKEKQEKMKEHVQSRGKKHPEMTPESVIEKEDPPIMDVINHMVAGKSYDCEDCGKVQLGSKCPNTVGYHV